MNQCKIIRRKLVRIGTMSLNGGETKFEKEEWREEECGVLIFGKDWKTRKVCDSCLKGWTHDHNFMLDTEENQKLLEEAKK